MELPISFAFFASLPFTSSLSVDVKRAKRGEKRDAKINSCLHGLSSLRLLTQPLAMLIVEGKVHSYSNPSRLSQLVARPLPQKNACMLYCSEPLLAFVVVNRDQSQPHDLRSVVSPDQNPISLRAPIRPGDHSDCANTAIGVPISLLTNQDLPHRAGALRQPQSSPSGIGRAVAG